MSGIFNQSSCKTSSVFLSAEQEVSEKKVCCNCNLAMTIKQINLTEALRLCWNCSFSLNSLGMSNIELLHRSFRDILKDPKEWSSSVSSEEQEIQKLKLWIEEVNRNLNMYDEVPSVNDSTWENQAGLSEVEVHQNTSEESNLQVLKELEVALEAASLQRSTNEDFPFSLDDLFMPVRCTKESKCLPQDTSTDRLCTESHTFSAPNELSGNKAKTEIPDLLDITERSSINENHPQSNLGNPTNFSQSRLEEQKSFENVCSYKGNCSYEAHSNGDVSNESITAVSRNEAGYNSFECTSIQSTGDSNLSCLSDNVNIQEDSLQSSCSSPSYRHDSTHKTYSCAKANVGFENVLKCDSVKNMVTYPIANDSYQLTEPPRLQDCIVNFSLPDLSIESCLPRAYDKDLWMPIWSNTSPNFHIKSEYGASENILMTVSVDGKDCFNLCIAQSMIDPTKSGERNGTVCLNELYGKESNLKSECDQSLIHLESCLNLNACPALDNLQEPFSPSTASPIVITIPPPQDISEEMMSSVNSVPIILEECQIYDNVIEFPANEFLCIQNYNLAKNRKDLGSKRHYDSGMITNSLPVVCEDSMQSLCHEVAENTSKDAYFKMNLPHGVHIIPETSALDRSDDSNYSRDLSETENHAIDETLAMSVRTEDNNSEHATDVISQASSKVPQSYINSDEDFRELMGFCGSKFKPKQSNYKKPSKRFSDVIGEGKYVNLWKIIQREMKFFDETSKKQNTTPNQTLRLYDGL